MPEVECRLWDGAVVAWDKQRATTSIRCQQCRTVFPGRYISEVNLETMRCRECEGKDQSHESQA